MQFATDQSEVQSNLRFKELDSVKGETSELPTKAQALDHHPNSDSNEPLIPLSIADDPPSEKNLTNVPSKKIKEIMDLAEIARTEPTREIIISSSKTETTHAVD